MTPTPAVPSLDDATARPPRRETALLAAAALLVVLLALALAWNRLADPAEPMAPAGQASAALPDHPALDACALALARRWSEARPTERASDVDRQPLRALASACARSAGPSATVYVAGGDGRLQAVLHGDPSLAGPIDVPGPADPAARKRTTVPAPAVAVPARPAVPARWSYPLPAADAGWLVVILAPGAVSASEANGRAGDLRPMLLLASLAVAVALLAGLRALSRAQRSWHQALHERQQAQRQHAQALAHEARERRELIEAVGVGLRVIDAQGRLLEVNPAFCQASGWPAAQLLGCEPPYPFWPDASEGGLHEAHLRAVLQGVCAPEGYQVDLVRPDGSRWTARVNARPLDGGRGWILASSDVTQELQDRRRIEALNETLRRLSSVSLLGQRSGDLLHQFSNHCGTCLHALSAARKQLQAGRPDAAAEGVELALSTVTQLGRVVEKFRPWLRDEVSLEPVSLRELAEDALVQEGSHAQRHHVTLGNRVAAALPPLTLDRMALSEVLSNLLHNAVTAMAVEPLSNRQVHVDSFLDEAAGEVLLRVCDLGPGVPVALREAVFERGFTQAAAGTEGGTGWGLANCRYWVEKLGGRIRLTDHQPRGTAVEIRLPLPLRSRTPDEPPTAT